MRVTKEQVLDHLKRGFEIHVCDGNERSATIGPVGDKLEFEPSILDELYKENVVSWLGGIGTSRGIESCFKLNTRAR